MPNINKSANAPIAQNMNNLHRHYGVHEAMDRLTPEQLKEFVSFRFRFLQEEVNEGFRAIEEQSAEEIIDSLIDLTVVAVGTLDLFDVDIDKAWNEVLRANMNKKVGIKESRPNPLGLPDLVKPEGWVGPDHTGNHGRLANLF